MDAIWYQDYDYRTDKIYKCPCCPDCYEPIGKFDDGNYRCYSCGKIVDIPDDEMKEWLRIREETKTEYHDCHKFALGDCATIGCGGKNCVETHYIRSPVTLEWQTAWSVCKNCGQKIMV